MIALVYIVCATFVLGLAVTEKAEANSSVPTRDAVSRGGADSRRAGW